MSCFKDLEVTGDCNTNYLKVVYFSAVSQVNKERLYCETSKDSLARLVSSTVVQVIWRKTVETNFFKLNWYGNCGGYVGGGGELESSASEDQRCDWTLDADTFNNIEYTITVNIIYI